MYHKVCPFKVYKSVFLVYSQSCVPPVIFSVRIFYHPKRNSVPIRSYYPIVPYIQPLAIISLLSVSMDLHILQITYKWNHRIIQYMAFCDWLLSFNIMFSRFIYVGACFSILILFIVE